MKQSIKSCGTCRYYERTRSRFMAENVGRCQWTDKHQRAAARLPQWIRDADKTVWDEDGKSCATWEEYE
jgi:hypothetical protein